MAASLPPFRFGPPVHPGGILRDIIIPGAGLDEAAFAARLGIPPAELTPVLEGAAPVTGALALRLGRLLGAGGADHWMRMQAAHDLAQAHQAIGLDVDRIAPLTPAEIAAAEASADLVAGEARRAG